MTGVGKKVRTVANRAHVAVRLFDYEHVVEVFVGKARHLLLARRARMAVVDTVRVQVATGLLVPEAKWGAGGEAAATEASHAAATCEGVALSVR